MAPSLNMVPAWYIPGFLFALCVALENSTELVNLAAYIAEC